MQTHSLSLRDALAHYMRAGGIVSGDVVNVGAADSCLHVYARECDEANELLRLKPGSKIVRGWGESRHAGTGHASVLDQVDFRGVLFDLSTEAPYVADLAATYSNVRIAGAVDAANIAEALDAFAVPRTFDVLKYDADGQDCDSILALLDAGFRPRLVLAEFNLLFPPPVKFNFPFTRGLFEWGKSTPHPVQLGNQCSLAFLSSHMSARGYVLLQADWWDALFVSAHVHQIAFSAAPMYDDLSWWLHGYVANAADDSARRSFLNATAFSPALEMAPETWLHAIREASIIGRNLDVDELTQMRTDLFYYCLREAVPMHDGEVQPFTLE